MSKNTLFVIFWHFLLLVRGPPRCPPKWAKTDFSRTRHLYQKIGPKLLYFHGKNQKNLMRNPDHPQKFTDLRYRGATASMPSFFPYLEDFRPIGLLPSKSTGKNRPLSYHLHARGGKSNQGRFFPLTCKHSIYI